METSFLYLTMKEVVNTATPFLFTLAWTMNELKCLNTHFRSTVQTLQTLSGPFEL